MCLLPKTLNRLVKIVQLSTVIYTNRQMLRSCSYNNSDIMQMQHDVQCNSHKSVKSQYSTEEYIHLNVTDIHP